MIYLHEWEALSDEEKEAYLATAPKYPPLLPKPCPAGECDAQIYGAGELVYCIKCGAKNPNFHHAVYERKGRKHKEVVLSEFDAIFGEVDEYTVIAEIDY